MKYKDFKQLEHKEVKHLEKFGSDKNKLFAEAELKRRRCQNE